MSAITREFTKEQLIEKLQHRISVASGFPESEKAQMDLELARIALASLEAEPVCVIDQANLDYLKSDSDADVWPASRIEMGDVLLYRAAMLQGADSELQRKAAIHDALCEKYNVESLDDFVDWQRNHIAELEAAPPAPVGEGETAVMPDYPGYTMTQRECFQAGKKAGLAEAGSSPVIPDGCALVPVEPTLEMIKAGANAASTGMLIPGMYRAMITAAPQQEVK